MSIFNDHRRYGNDEEREEWKSEVKWEYRGEDGWEEETYCICNNCRFYALDEERDEMYCACEDSVNYTEYTSYKDSCVDWEEA